MPWAVSSRESGRGAGGCPGTAQPPLPPVLGELPLCFGADHFSWLKCSTSDRNRLSSEAGTQRAVGRLWKERGRREREGRESAGERERAREEGEERGRLLQEQCFPPGTGNSS